MRCHLEVEPGRYIVAECGTLLGQVYSKKTNYNKTYVETDLGFNVLMRSVLYDSHHDIEVYSQQNKASDEKEEVIIVGNICESGDIIGERVLPKIEENDILGVANAGAYGFSMSSNYNCRLRPAEALIDINGNDKLIRRRDTLEDLLKNF